MSPAVESAELVKALQTTASDARGAAADYADMAVAILNTSDPDPDRWMGVAAKTTIANAFTGCSELLTGVAATCLAVAGRLDNTDGAQ